jgi:hypothetical protein
VNILKIEVRGICHGGTGHDRQTTHVTYNKTHTLIEKTAQTAAGVSKEQINHLIAELTQSYTNGHIQRNIKVEYQRWSGALYLPVMVAFNFCVRMSRYCVLYIHIGR